MRLVVYADSALFSGAEALLCDVVSGLAEAPGIEITVVAPCANTELTKRLGEAAKARRVIDTPTQMLPLAALDLFNPRRLAAVRGALRPLRADALLINLPSLEYGATPLVADPLPGVTTLGLAHITGSMRALGFRMGALRERLARRAARRLDHVIVLSDQAAADFPSTWGRPGIPTHVIRMPAPDAERVERRAAREAIGLPQDAPIIGIAGRVTIKQKGHDTLLEAAPAIIENHPEARFAVAGEGRDLARVKEMAEQAGLAERFHFLGYVNPIGRFLSALDAIAIPSRFEGLPLIALEALQIGVPGVASSVDGLCDVWPERWRTPADDPPRMARALSELLAVDRRVRDEMIAEGRRLMAPRVAENASIDVAAVLHRLNGSQEQ